MIATQAPPTIELAAHNLVKVYKKRAVVNGISITIKQGEIVALFGTNGAGKTTTFYMMVGLVRPERGTVFLGDDDITRLPMYARARRGIGYLAQENSVFRKLTTEENILLVLEMHRDAEGNRMPARQRKARAEELMEDLGLTARRDSTANVLSGGERRRVEIARVLATDPKFVLLDEPFTGIDPLAINDLQKIVGDLKNRGIGVLITEHKVEAALDIVDSAYIVSDGEIKTKGTPAELVDDPIARQYYFGEGFKWHK